MVERCKKSHDWINIITVQGTCIVKTIPITKKLDVQTKKPIIVFMYYDFHFGLSDEKEYMLFAT